MAAVFAFLGLAGCGGNDNGSGGNSVADDGGPTSDGTTDAPGESTGDATHDAAHPAMNEGGSDAHGPVDSGPADARPEGGVDASVDGAAHLDAASDAKDGGGQETSTGAGPDAADAGAEAAAEDASVEAGAEDGGGDAGTEDVATEAGLEGDAEEAGGEDAADGVAALAPDSPTGVTAVSGDTQVTVNWAVPNDNGSPILDYTVTATDGATTRTVTATGAAATSAVVSGLVNGTSYSFTVTARNAVGSSPPSSPAVTSIPAGAPLAPAITMLVPGDMLVIVTWTAPSDNGSPISGYTVTPSPADVAAVTAGPAATSATISGLTDCNSYTFTVTASNAVGTGAPSAPSSAVVPAPVATVSYFTQIQNGIFTTYNCTGVNGCHGASGNLTISYADIVNVQSAEMTSVNYITPGDPGRSYLWCKVSPNDSSCLAAATVIAGAQMPRGGPVVSATDMATLKTWIQECAPNN